VVRGADQFRCSSFALHSSSTQSSESFYYCYDPVLVAKLSVTEDLSVLLVRKDVLIAMKIYSQFVRKGFGRDSNVASNVNENLSYCSRCQEPQWVVDQLAHR